MHVYKSDLTFISAPTYVVAHGMAHLGGHYTNARAPNHTHVHAHSQADFFLSFGGGNGLCHEGI